MTNIDHKRAVLSLKHYSSFTILTPHTLSGLARGLSWLATQ
jgi:hypothetical protein